MITAQGLTKHYGQTVAVDNISFEIKPGVVTGFLGPNGSGKSTTMRMMLGLDVPTSGSVTIDGRDYRGIQAPARKIGALLDAKAMHGSRSAWNHLNWIAKASDIPSRRVDEVLEMVGLEKVAGKKVGGFSLGMSQRLGIATALLGDPENLLFDEPVNGLDPDGILWFRNLMKKLAAEGRTVFVSSHLMSEMQATADHVLVIGKGKIIADAPMVELTGSSNGNAVRVTSPELGKLTRILEAAGATMRQESVDSGVVQGLPAADIGDLAAQYTLPLHELTPQRASLETAFMELTRSSVEYKVGENGHGAAIEDAIRDIEKKEESIHV